MCIRDSIAQTISTLRFSRKSKNRRNCSLNNSTVKAKPKMTVKNGIVYGDALSAQEKKRIAYMNVLRRLQKADIASCAEANLTRKKPQRSFLRIFAAESWGESHWNVH